MYVRVGGMYVCASLCAYVWGWDVYKSMHADAIRRQNISINHPLPLHHTSQSLQTRGIQVAPMSGITTPGGGAGGKKKKGSGPKGKGGKQSPAKVSFAS